MTPTTLRIRDAARVTWFAPAALVVALAGCGQTYDTSGEKVYPVKGQVLLGSGKPLTAGKVHFLPKQGFGLPSSGEISSDGSYTLKTADGREGAAAGEYKVRIEPNDPNLSKKAGRAAAKSLPFPAVYMDEDGDTGLTATVKPESNDIPPFKLVAPPAAKGGRDRD